MSFPPTADQLADRILALTRPDACVLVRQRGIIEHKLQDTGKVAGMIPRVQRIYGETVRATAARLQAPINLEAEAAVELAVAVASDFCNALRGEFAALPDDYALALLIAKNLPYPLAAVLIEGAGEQGQAVADVFFSRRIACCESAMQAAHTALGPFASAYAALDEQMTGGGGEKRVQVWVQSLLEETSSQDARFIILVVAALWMLLCRESNDHRHGGAPPLPVHLSTVAGADPWTIAVLLLALVPDASDPSDSSDSGGGSDNGPARAVLVAHEMDDTTKTDSAMLLAVASNSTAAVTATNNPVLLNPNVHGTGSLPLTYRQVMVFEMAVRRFGGLGALRGLFNEDVEATRWYLLDSNSEHSDMLRIGYPPKLAFHAVRRLVAA